MAVPKHHRRNFAVRKGPPWTMVLLHDGQGPQEYDWCNLEGRLVPAGSIVHPTCRVLQIERTVLHRKGEPRVKIGNETYDYAEDVVERKLVARGVVPGQIKTLKIPQVL